MVVVDVYGSAVYYIAVRGFLRFVVFAFWFTVMIGSPSTKYWRLICINNKHTLALTLIQIYNEYSCSLGCWKKIDTKLGNVNTETLYYTHTYTHTFTLLMHVSTYVLYVNKLEAFFFCFLLLEYCRTN